MQIKNNREAIYIEVLAIVLQYLRTEMRNELYQRQFRQIAAFNIEAPDPIAHQYLNQCSSAAKPSRPK